MSFTKVLPYFRECLCDLGYEEWETELGSEDAPNTIIEKSFRLDLGNITADPASHTTFEYLFPVTLFLYFKTFSDPVENIEHALESIEEVLCCLLAAEKRYGAELKSISPDSIVFEPVSISNDNVLKAVMDFDVKLLIEYRDQSPV